MAANWFPASDEWRGCRLLLPLVYLVGIGPAAGDHPRLHIDLSGGPAGLWRHQEERGFHDRNALEKKAGRVTLNRSGYFVNQIVS